MVNITLIGLSIIQVLQVKHPSVPEVDEVIDIQYEVNGEPYHASVFVYERRHNIKRLRFRRKRSEVKVYVKEVTDD